MPNASTRSAPFGARRHRRRRRGSILILVIALLVMLALIGTAFMTTARQDRSAAAVGSTTAQLDLLGDAASKVAAAAIANDLIGVDAATGSQNYRFPTPYTTGPGGVTDYHHWDAPSTDTFLASRVPTGTGAAPVWEWITGPLSIAGDPTTTQFEDPLTLFHWSINPVTNPVTERHNAAIPASGMTLTVNGATHTAGDADGDGVPDSGLIRLGSLPGARFAGLTFYAGVRIIDGNSAVNLSTAWTNGNTTDRDLTGAPRRNNRLNPASVGLAELVGLAPFSDTVDWQVGLTGLNNYRYHQIGTDLNTITDQRPAADYDPTVNPAVHTPSPRLDFTWRSQMDWFWNQLGRRIEFPGFIAPGFTTFQAVPFSDTLDLAYGFVLRHPNASKDTTETYLPSSTYNGKLGGRIPTSPSGYPSRTFWFNFNFDVGPGSTNTASSLRSIFVTRNPVSNAAPAHYGTLDYDIPPNGLDDPALSEVQGMARYNYGKSYKGLWNNGTSYNQGDVVLFTRGTSPYEDAQPYVALSANTATDPTAPVVPPVLPVWRLQPFGNHVVPKTNINVAPFAELFRSFWNVMANSPATGPGNQSPFGNAAADNQATNVYAGNTFTNPDPTTTAQAPANFPRSTTEQNGTGAAVASQHVQRMFRSPIRDPHIGTRVYLDQSQTVLLRAALAAVNVEALRIRATTAAGVLPDVPVEHVQLGNTNGVAYSAVVAGTQPQPFISEVFVQTDNQTVPTGQPGPNPSGYVAIELYNPYEVPITMTGWQLGFIDKTPGVAAYPLSFDTAKTLAIPSGTVVPARQRIVIDNFTGNTASGAAFRPGSANLTTGTTAIPNLGLSVYDREMVILRPRLAAGPSSGTYPDGTAYTESGQIADMVPIDSFDFTGVAAPNGGTANNYHYVRENPAGNADWKCVYPGHYDGSQPSRRQQGTQESTVWNIGPGAVAPNTDPWDTAVGGAPPATAPPALGAADGTASYPADTGVQFPVIQLNSVGFPAPGFTIAATANQYPFGGFMRDGDILQVPFIGSYVILPAAPVTAGTFMEVNPVTADVAFADDTDPTDDAEENVGRFTPICPPTAIAGIDEFDFQTPTNVRYGWAGRLFDYFSVSSPQSDYLPAVDPSRYKVGATPPSSQSPQPIPHAAKTFTNGTTVQADEDVYGEDGRININTAPASVLNTIPWTRSAATNAAIVNAIIARRAANYAAPSQWANRPQFFRSIFELNEVAGFRDANGTYPTSGGAFTSTSGTAFKTYDNGDFSPLNADAGGASLFAAYGTNGSGSDGVGGDFESQFLNLTAISNLITTRSDTFVVYIVVEGWENAGGPGANRVIQRRYAYWVDRNNVTPTNRTPRVVPIPTN